MDNSSYFIKNRALFGSFPSKESVEELENNGIKYFINLTEPDEKKITPYSTTQTYISYPIKDNNIPTNIVTFSAFIINISNIVKNLNNDEKIYIHCRGGHSRSALVVACLLCYIFNLTPSQSLEYTTKCHGTRKNMRDRWRKVSAPQNYIQIKFVYKFFEPLKFYKHNKHNVFTYGFSNMSGYPVTTELGVFDNAQSAYEKHLNNYCEENNVLIENINHKILVKIMYHILKLKFNQNQDIKNKLINTGLRQLIEHIKNDEFWADGSNGEGKNFLGKILTKLRNKYYEDIDFDEE